VNGSKRFKTKGGVLGVRVTLLDRNVQQTNPNAKKEGKVDKQRLWTERRPLEKGTGEQWGIEERGGFHAMKDISVIQKDRPRGL